MTAGTRKLRRAISVDNDSQLANDGQLVAEARSEPAAFARLYRRHYDAVFRYCVHRLFDKAIAEDVTSAVFLKAVENFGRFRGSEQQFRNWLYKIATNTVNSHLRKAARRNSLLKHTFEQAENRGDCQATTAENLVILKRAMLELKPRYQTIITLRFFENLKSTEIAQVLASSDGTIRSQLARALAKLRKKLATDLTDYTD
jgi:RNA polymerase sigma-70 factor (ECF subfamily)